MENTKVIAVIGDIVESRMVRDRYELQEQLHGIFIEIKARNRAILSPYTITLGDEFQALYSSSDSLFFDIWEILLKLYPIKARFSIGIGNLSTPLNRTKALGMDGPVFYSARNGITKLKGTDKLFTIEGENIVNLDIINDILYLVSNMIMDWKKNRLKILMELWGGKPPKKIANELDLSDVAVYKNIKSAGLDILIDLNNRIAEHINNSLRD